MLPVANEDGTLYGMLSAGDVASYDMLAVRNALVEHVPVYNLLSVLEGRVLNAGGQVRDEVSGEVTIALPAGRENLLFSSSESIVVCGDQPDMIRRAIELHAACVIVCQAEVQQELLDMDTDTCIISTPYDAYRAVHLICHALPIERICKSHDLVCFHLDDYIDDVRNAVLESRFRAYPILDEHEHVVGTLSRFHLLRPRRKQVILVDHNEKAQSVAGLDQADILEIVDHHRLADIETTNPIYVRNEPVGSSATIVADMYQEKGLMPTAKMAGLMASAIVSDTVMFKSPTCTQRDIDIANRMARIANVSLEDLGKTVFSASVSDDKSAEMIIGTDYKEFHIAGHNLAVSQVTCMDAERLTERTEEFLDCMRGIRHDYGLDTVLLMITDVLKEGSYLLYVGDEDTIRQAFNISGEKNLVFLPEVMSRKKQIIPVLSAPLGLSRRTSADRRRMDFPYGGFFRSSISALCRHLRKTKESCFPKETAPFQAAALFHQLAHQIRVAGGIVQRQTGDQQRLIVQQPGVLLGLFRVGSDGGFQRREDRMLRVQFQNPLGLDAAFRLHHLEILLHLKAQTFPSRQAHRMGFQPDGGLHLCLRRLPASPSRRRTRPYGCRRLPWPFS